MSDTGWLIVAIVAGIAIAVFYVWRELWVQRRWRRRDRDP